MASTALYGQGQRQDSLPSEGQGQRMLSPRGEINVKSSQKYNGDKYGYDVGNSEISSDSDSSTYEDRNEDGHARHRGGYTVNVRELQMSPKGNMSSLSRSSSSSSGSSVVSPIPLPRPHTTTPVHTTQVLADVGIGMTSPVQVPNTGAGDSEGGHRGRSLPALFAGMAVNYPDMERKTKSEAEPHLPASTSNSAFDFSKVDMRVVTKYLEHTSPSFSEPISEPISEPGSGSIDQCALEAEVASAVGSLEQYQEQHVEQTYTNDASDPLEEFPFAGTKWAVYQVQFSALNFSCFIYHSIVV